MSEISLQVRLNGPQLKAYAALGDGRTVFLGWGRGVGKSYFLRLVCWLLIAEWDGKVCHPSQPFRGVRIGWLMPSRKQFIDVHATSILDELGPGGKFEFLGGKINRSTWHISFPGGSELIPFPATDANSKAARGYRAHFVIVDECDDVSIESYNSVAVPWMSAHWSFRRELLAGTPTRGRHGLWYRMLDDGRKAERLRQGYSAEDVGVDPDYIVPLQSIFGFHATYKDVPETVSPAAVAKAKATTPQSTFEREWEANPDAGEGLVYVFDDTFHVRDDVPHMDHFREFHVGMDHGWTDPGCLLFAGIIGHGNDAVLWILDEHYQSETQNGQWNEWARAWNYATFWPDPSRPDRVDDLRRMGITVGETDNNILGGIARVADLLHIRETEDGHRYARMFVSPKCVNLIREMGLYRRKRNGDGTFSEKPEDKNNHAMDCLRYISVGRFGRGEAYRHEAPGR